ncbi:MAG: hypothetical protein KTR32_09600 [Granulosicoccus sp.]|nr:hypothetical protein [Granulosicoccus sp.]
MITTAVDTTEVPNTPPNSLGAENKNKDKNKHVLVASANPWHKPKTIKQVEDNEHYCRLKQRLAIVPTRSRHSRQALYVDLWTGQHWLGLALSGPTPSELLKPVSNDTAHSIAQGDCSRALSRSRYIA